MTVLLCFFQVQSDLSDPDMAYGLLSRTVGIESGISLVRQFGQIQEYLEHLLMPSNNHNLLSAFFDETSSYLLHLRKPIYMCVAARIMDLNSVLSSIAKVKWDNINHVNVEQSTYVNNINRVNNVKISLESATKSNFIHDSFSGSSNVCNAFRGNRKNCSSSERANLGLYSSCNHTHFGRRVRIPNYSIQK